MINNTVLNIQDSLKSYHIECWTLYSDEQSDPYLHKYFAKHAVSATICIITQNDCYLLVNDLDFDNIEVFDNIKNVRYTSLEGSKLFDKYFEIIKTLAFPNEISFSYSTLQDTLIDVIGHGTFNHLTTKISEFYNSNQREVKFTSAEKAIYGLSDRKNDLEIERLKLAAFRADQILSDSFKSISVGMSEKQIASLVHNIFESKPEYFNDKDVVSEEFSWSKKLCPIVLTGPNFTKGGHAIASDTELRPGYTLYFDFGVKLNFNDGTSFSSDIQRMGYALKPGETVAPKKILDIFNVLYESISIGIANLKSGKKGYEIDHVVRNYIQTKGYIDYDHSTGHSVGETTHNPGTLLGPQREGLSSLEIQPNGVYTIEPRIPIENGGSIEEMVLATPEGGLAISPRQTKLYLIKS